MSSFIYMFNKYFQILIRFQGLLGAKNTMLSKTELLPLWDMHSTKSVDINQGFI